MGNPAIYWLGIIVLPLMIWKFIKTKRLGLGFLLLAFAAQYLPYIFIQRINWIYYFYSATPFLFMLIAYSLSNIMDVANGKYTKLVKIYLMLCVILFVAFYPVISGAEINRAYVYYALHWFKGWIF
jgi:dolichyl-phosphate-mannose--protein O-mannosyl transferase